MTQKQSCLILTNGRIGTVKPCRALAQALNLKVTEQSLQVRFPWSLLPARFWFFSQLAYKNFNFSSIASKATDFPDYVITSGRTAVNAGIEIKKRAQKRNVLTKAIHLMDPKVSPEYFDAVICPEHDKISGENVIKCLGTLHDLSEQKLDQLPLKSPFEKNKHHKMSVGVFIGGPSKHFIFNESVMDQLVQDMQALSKTHQLLITPSRRTPEKLMSALYATLDDSHYIWSGSGENPYFDILKQSDALVVTCDSVSMMSEFASLTTPFFIYYLPSKSRGKNKILAFADRLLAEGYGQLYSKEALLKKSKEKRPLKIMPGVVERLRSVAVLRKSIN